MTLETVMIIIMFIFVVLVHLILMERVPRQPTMMIETIVIHKHAHNSNNKYNRHNNNNKKHDKNKASSTSNAGSKHRNGSVCVVNMVVPQSSSGSYQSKQLYWQA